MRIFGVIGDGAEYQFTLTASTTNKSPTGVPITTVAPYKGDPWYVTVANATAASKIMNMMFGYINK